MHNTTRGKVWHYIYSQHGLVLDYINRREIKKDSNQEKKSHQNFVIIEKEISQDFYTSNFTYIIRVLLSELYFLLCSSMLVYT